jgi:4-hydroxythreonine-4-phosphate dehydrogenase
MFFAGPRLRVGLATVHLSLRDAIAALDVDTIVGVTGLVAESLTRDFGIAEPRIGIVGLNPHAGEGGLFGREEYETVVPAVEESRRRVAAEVSVAGPLVPDVAFREAVTYGKYDALIALYHDQGLIPVKLLDFDQTVNVTLGLPIIRTSPAHGVAYGIAGTGQASPQSFIAALDLAIAVVDRRG